MLGLADKRPTEMQQRGCIKLLSFALCSCTPDNLPELLALVDIEVLAQNKLAPLTQKVASDGSSGLLARALLGATSNANSISVTASLSAPTLWAGGAEHSLPLLSLEVESATVDDIKKAAASLSAVTAKLQDAPSNATARAEMSRLCVELARRSARSDAPFAIALMLSCPDAALATETLKTLTAPTNPTALVVVVYVAAMALYGQELAVWTQPPHVLIDRARNHSRGEAPLQQQPWLDVIDWYAGF